MKKRSLRLAKDTLTELESDELRQAVGATNLCNPCIFTWSCDEIKTLKCLRTRLC